MRPKRASWQHTAVTDEHDLAAGRRPERKAPRPPDVSPQGIERAALSYLERFDSSVANLRRVLCDRVRKAQLRSTQPIDRAAALSAIDALLARYCESGLLSDRRYGQNLLTGLRQRGMSTRRARLKLTTKGLDEALVDELLEQEADASDQDAELIAALAYVRKRRLGHYRRAAPTASSAPRADEAGLDQPAHDEGAAEGAEPSAGDPERRSGPKAWRLLPTRASARGQADGANSAALSGKGNGKGSSPRSGFKRASFKRAQSPEAARRDKDLATLARRGFSFEIARRALDAPPED